MVRVIRGDDLLFTRIEPELFSNFDPFSVPIFFVVYEALNATPLTYAILLYWHLSNSSIRQLPSQAQRIGSYDSDTSSRN
jgi:hypothetical protein